MCIRDSDVRCLGAPLRCPLRCPERRTSMRKFAHVAVLHVLGRAHAKTFRSGRAVLCGPFFIHCKNLARGTMCAPPVRLIVIRFAAYTSNTSILLVRRTIFIEGSDCDSGLLFIRRHIAPFMVCLLYTSLTDLVIVVLGPLCPSQCRHPRSARLVVLATD